VKIVGIGIGIVTTDAFNVGITAMPDPQAEPSFPWLYWSVHALRAEIADGATSPADQSGSKLERVVVDSKAMRKVRPNQSLAIMFDAINLSGTGTVAIVVPRIRVLVGR